MMNLTIRKAAIFVAGLLMTIPLASQEAPAAPSNRPPELTSEELAKQPQTPGATGDQQRHYYFVDARVESPYRIYVPKSYDGKTKMRVIVALHGAGANQNYFFRPAYGMHDLMEKYGFILGLYQIME